MKGCAKLFWRRSDGGGICFLLYLLKTVSVKPQCVNIIIRNIKDYPLYDYKADGAKRNFKKSEQRNNIGTALAAL